MAATSEKGSKSEIPVVSRSVHIIGNASKIIERFVCGKDVMSKEHVE